MTITEKPITAHYISHAHLFMSRKRHNRIRQNWKIFLMIYTVMNFVTNIQRKKIFCMNLLFISLFFMKKTNKQLNSPCVIFTARFCLKTCPSVQMMMIMKTIVILNLSHWFNLQWDRFCTTNWRTTSNQFSSQQRSFRITIHSDNHGAAITVWNMYSLYNVLNCTYCKQKYLTSNNIRVSFPYSIASKPLLYNVSCSLL